MQMNGILTILPTRVEWLSYDYSFLHTAAETPN